MGYNITNLPDFKTEGKAFVIKSILESQTLGKLNDAGSFDPTAKGTQTVQLLDTDLVIQDGANCGFTPQGSAILSQAMLTVKQLKINEEYCPRQLVTTWAKGELKAGQEYDSIVFLNDISEINSKKAALELEKMVWLGDTVSGATASLRQIDGFVKQIKAASGTTGYVNLSGATGTTTLAKLQKVNSLMPIEVRGQDDFRIFIGKDVFDAYVADLAALNLFNQPESGTILGTTAKYEVVNGLNGGHIVAARYRNLQAGGEMTDVDFESWYSRDDDTLKLKSRFSLGVVPVYPQEIGYTKIAA
jgi:hypothetical protein